jgi:EAL domain-containing protein (putative c-di-GMP-specific phosphodiesterase class I)
MCPRSSNGLPGPFGSGDHHAGNDLDPFEAARALRSGEIEAEFQPRVELATGRLTGVEALARWWRIAAAGPAHFVPAIAKAGLSGQLTLRIVDVACDAIDIWNRAGLTPRITINVSMTALGDPFLAHELADRARGRGVEPKRFIFELSEDGDPGPRATETLTKLRREGFDLATSLSQLGRFPFSELKIDQGLVRNCDHSRHRQRLVQSAMALARRVNAHTVAEGIETVGEWHVLAAAGCNEGQGYFVGSPLPPTSLPKWHQAWRASYPGRVAADPGSGRPGRPADIQETDG